MEARVADNSRAVMATIVGAVVGGFAGYLFFTDRGRALRRQLEPALDDIARELSQFRGTVQKASGVANEGWKLLNEALGESTKQPPRYPTTHQSSPF
jgi:gas vesicle protein